MLTTILVPTRAEAFLLTIILSLVIFAIGAISGWLKEIKKVFQQSIQIQTLTDEKELLEKQVEELKKTKQLPESSRIPLQAK